MKETAISLDSKRLLRAGLAELQADILLRDDIDLDREIPGFSVPDETVMNLAATLSHSRKVTLPKGEKTE